MNQLKPIIIISNVSKKYVIRNWKTVLFKRPTVVAALKNISLTVQPGEILGVLGPNGAGKTTLLKILATLVTPDTGSVEIMGRDCVNEADVIRQQVGFVNTNSRSFYWRLTAKENLSFFGHLFNMHGKILDKRIDKAISLVGLYEKRNRKIGTYSSGERQRLAIARAIISNPKILLMDEATANLDPIVSKDLIQFTKETLTKKQGKTVIWCTHNLKEADELCDRVAILDKGQIVTCEKPAVLKNNIAQHERYRLVLSSIPTDIEKTPGYEKHEGINGSKCCTIQIETRHIPDLIQKLVSNKIKVYECTLLEQPLDEAFIKLMVKQK